VHLHALDHHRPPAPKDAAPCTHEDAPMQVRQLEAIVDAVDILGALSSDVDGPTDSYNLFLSNAIRALVLLGDSGFLGSGDICSPDTHY